PELWGRYPPFSRPPPAGATAAPGGGGRLNEEPLSYCEVALGGGADLRATCARDQWHASLWPQVPAVQPLVPSGGDLRANAPPPLFWHAPPARAPIRRQRRLHPHASKDLAMALSDRPASSINQTGRSLPPAHSVVSPSHNLSFWKGRSQMSD